MSRKLYKTEDGLNELTNKEKKEKFEGVQELNKKQITGMIDPLFNDIFEKSFSNRLIYKVKYGTPSISIFDFENKTCQKVKTKF